MKIIHVCDGWEPWNGAANIARMIAGEQRASGHETALARWASVRALRAADEVWVHCGWKPVLWWAALWGRRVRWVPEACYDPLRLRFHAWKKRPAGFVERFFLRRCDTLVATCAAEAGWIRAYLGARCPPVAVTDIRRFFKLDAAQARPDAHPGGGPLHVLYLGRRHPLKGLKYLEEAVARANGGAGANEAQGRVVELKTAAGATGEEKERLWAWCDVLCLPTLSDNFGLVVAEALERGCRVIVTDGAPAWDPAQPGAAHAAWRDRLTYLSGYRNGSDEIRTALLASALKTCRLKSLPRA